jgi:O-antigen/teichoic acid export membrane protein
MEEKQVQRLRVPALFARLSRGRGPIALADQMMVSAANFAGGIVLVRGLGLEEFGKYSIAYSLLLFANALQMSFVASPMLNIGPLLQNEEKEHFVNGMLTLQMLASLLLFVVFALVGLVARVFTAFYSVPCILLFACCIGTYQLQDWLRRYY